jgi:Carboxypeptidase regulatory-like domain
MRALAICWTFMVTALVCSAVAGVVEGVVLDESARPVEGAKVHLAENRPFAGHRVIQFYESDAQGRFLISNVPFGSYYVLAGKEGAGYPDTKLAFYSNLEAPIVTLSADAPRANVTVKLPQKAATLRILSIADATTGKAVADPVLTARRVARPDLYISTPALSAGLLMPSDVDVAIEITAPGYKRWSNVDSTAANLRLKPGEVRDLSIKLQRDISAQKK